MTSIPESTLQAYRETNFDAQGAKPMTLRIGQFNEELMHLHAEEQVQCSTFITAYNPLGQAFEDAVNVARQAALAKELAARNLTFIAGIGQQPTDPWPGEVSFLVLGLSLEAARALGTKHEQNAIVWCDADAVPQLVLLR